MSEHGSIMDGDPTLVLLRRLGNDLRSLRGQVPQRLQAARTAQSRSEFARAERMLTQLAARIRAKQEELHATAAAMPDDVRAEHRREIDDLLAIYPTKLASS
jgi:hypothetical protein